VLRSPRRTEEDYFLVFLFVVSLATVLIIYFVTAQDSRPGAALMDSQTFSFWLAFLITLTASSSGVVFTYSLVSYLRDRRFGSLILVFVTANLVILTFLIFMVHPAFAGWSPFSDRDKARTLITALSWTLAVGVFCAAYYGDSPTTQRTRNIVLAMGAGVVPASSFLLFLSPIPVFYTVYPGTDTTTPLGWFLLVVDVVFAAATVVKFTTNWYGQRRRFDLAFLLTMILWIVALVIYQLQMQTYEVSGLLWVGSLYAGFLELAAAMIVTAVFETHRELDDMIAERTRQLRLSREESDFYLRMWSHEIGNALQGMVTYLELMSEHGDPNRNLNKAAMDLAAKTTLIIRQVGKLSQVKETQDQQLKQLNLLTAISDAANTAHGILGERSFTVETICRDDDVLVVADDLLELVFVNLIVQSVRHSSEGVPYARIEASVSPDSVTVVFSCPGAPLSQTIELSLTGEIVPAATALGLDLFTVKLLVGRYGARVAYAHDTGSKRNIFTLLFRRWKGTPGQESHGRHGASGG
jgi:signal transduction histidine kinase